MSFLPAPGRVKRDKDQFVRLFLYAEPGFGKSYFANQFPDPFIINTDGNLPYYTAPGLIVNQWEASKNDPDSKNRSFIDIIDELVKTNGNGYKTIVIDLIENVYELARQAKLLEFGINHESDAGGYGKGYQLVRDPFYTAIKKLYSLPLNILLLSHENNKTIKDRIGREYSYFTPNLTESVVEKLTGTGYTLRGYWKGSLTNDNMESKAKRMLSLSPKDNELHVARLIDADGNPVELDDIELSYENFISVLKNLNDPEKVGTFKTVHQEEEKPKAQLKKHVQKETTPSKPSQTTPSSTTSIHNVEPKILVDTIVETIVEQDNKVVHDNTLTEPARQIQATNVVEVQPKETHSTTDTSISDEKLKKIEALKAKYLQKGRP